MKTLILIFALFFAQSALATGETYCNGKTDEIEVNVYLLNSRTPGSAVLNGEVTIKLLKENTELKMTHKNMVGWWSLGDDLKMHFITFAQGNDKRDTQLIIEANHSDVHETILGTLKFIGPQGQEFTEIVNCELG